MQTWALTHRGLKRPDNQDRYLVRELPGDGLLLAVADGMGGQAGGGVAAQMAVEALQGLDPEQAASRAGLKRLFTDTCRQILCKAEANPELEGMGTTLTAVHVQGGRATWAHVGDSRLYLWRAGSIRQISQDHNAAAFMVAEGLLEPEQAGVHPSRHMLLDCLGCGDCEPDTGSLDLRPQDLLLLTTDGLHGAVPDPEIRAVLAGPPAGPRPKLEYLLQKALEAGGRDNITAVGMQL